MKLWSRYEAAPASAQAAPEEGAAISPIIRTQQTIESIQKCSGSSSLERAHPEAEDVAAPLASRSGHALFSRSAPACLTLYIGY